MFWILVFQKKILNIFLRMSVYGNNSRFPSWSARWAVSKHPDTYRVRIRLCPGWFQFLSGPTITTILFDRDLCLSLFQERHRWTARSSKEVSYLHLFTCDLESKIFHWKENMHSLVAYYISTHFILKYYWLALCFSFGLNKIVTNRKEY